MYKLTSNPDVVLLDNANIPLHAASNLDCQIYLKWLADGNTPAPAEPQDAKIEALAQIDTIERKHLAPRFLREYLLADFAAKAAAAGKSPSALPAYVKLKALDDQIAALRALLV